MADDYMADFAQPHLRYAVAPITGVLCLLLGLMAGLRQPTPLLATNEVVAMKPVAGDLDTPAFEKVPVEALYGVPTKRTEHLWIQPKP